MKLKRINGLVFEKMVRNGLANLQMNEAKLNAMNVFPVTDGDTGTNMCLTLKNGVDNACSNANLAHYLKQLSDGMLLGARGNSGVILSQIFRGFYLALSSDSIADVSELRDAFIRGYLTAYQAVVRPVEGTMLTVARLGIENIKAHINRNVFVPNLFSMYLAEMRKVLAQTPEMLPVLKEAGVLDSGGYGYVLLVEGMEKSLYGEDITFSATEVSHSTPVTIDKTKFNENSRFELGYCTEFLLQLLNSRQSFDIDDYIKALNRYGDSLVCVKNDSIVKVHIHTRLPANVIAESQKYGEFISFKLENMQLQHDELSEVAVSKEIEHKDIAVIAISNGEGIKEMFDSFGVDVIIDGGKTMNTSAEEILNAIKSVNAEKIVIFPNHENIFKATEQAVKLSGQNNIIIAPTKDVLHCYYALAMDIGDYEDIDSRLEMFRQGYESINTVSIVECAKTCTINNVNCFKGYFVAICDGKPIACEKDYRTLISALKDKSFFDEKEAIIVSTGQEVNDEQVQWVNDYITSLFPEKEVSIIEGKQRTYNLIIGVI